jgi:hypothetical protein
MRNEECWLQVCSLSNVSAGRQNSVITYRKSPVLTWWLKQTPSLRGSVTAPSVKSVDSPWGNACGQLIVCSINWFRKNTPTEIKSKFLRWRTLSFISLHVIQLLLLNRWHAKFKSELMATKTRLVRYVPRNADLVFTEVPNHFSSIKFVGFFRAKFKELSLN